MIKIVHNNGDKKEDTVIYIIMTETIKVIMIITMLHENKNVTRN